MARIVCEGKPVPTGDTWFLIGESNFTRYMVHEGNPTYVDKTKFLNEWWDSGDKISIIVRPSRFGKTMIMSMVDAWFNSDDSSTIFDGTYIKDNASSNLLAAREDVYSLFMTFRYVQGSNIVELYGNLRFVIKDSLRRFKEFIKGFEEEEGTLPSAENPTIDSVSKLLNYLVEFIKYVYSESGKTFIVLIDEYDNFLKDASSSNPEYFGDLVRVYRNFLSSMFKDTDFVERAILTGELPLAVNNITSSFNNVVQLSFINSQYKDIFGFTTEEIELLVSDDECRESIEENLYGYNAGVWVKDGEGSVTVLNPWSVVNYIKNKNEGIVRNTLVSTGTSSWIENSSQLNKDDLSKVYSLLAGEEVSIKIVEELNFNNSGETLDNFLTYAFYSGYLTFVETDGTQISLKIPNREVHDAWVTNVIRKIAINY